MNAPNRRIIDGATPAHLQEKTLQLEAEGWQKESGRTEYTDANGECYYYQSLTRPAAVLVHESSLNNL